MLMLPCELHEDMQNSTNSPFHETEPLLLSLLQVIGQIVVLESLDGSSTNFTFPKSTLVYSTRKKTIQESMSLDATTIVLCTDYQCL